MALGVEDFTRRDRGPPPAAARRVSSPRRRIEEPSGPGVAQHGGLKPPPEPRVDETFGAGAHASERRRRHQEAQAEHERELKRYQSERERRRHSREEAEKSQRMREEALRQQQALREDPNAFDQGLAHIYRGRAAGTEAAALLTNWA